MEQNPRKEGYQSASDHAEGLVLDKFYKQERADIHPNINHCPTQSTSSEYRSLDSSDRVICSSTLSSPQNQTNTTHEDPLCIIPTQDMSLPISYDLSYGCKSEPDQNKDKPFLSDKVIDPENAKCCEIKTESTIIWDQDISNAKHTSNDKERNIETVSKFRNMDTSIDYKTKTSERLSETMVKNTTSCVFRCGGCMDYFEIINELHQHMLCHSSRGSYKYIHAVRTAYPTFDTVCVSTQTTSSILSGIVSNDSDFDEDNNRESVSHQLAGQSEKVVTANEIHLNLQSVCTEAKQLSKDSETDTCSWNEDMFPVSPCEDNDNDSQMEETKSREMKQNRRESKIIQTYKNTKADNDKRLSRDSETDTCSWNEDMFPVSPYEDNGSDSAWQECGSRKIKLDTCTSRRKSKRIKKRNITKVKIETWPSSNSDTDTRSWNEDMLSDSPYNDSESDSSWEESKCRKKKQKKRKSKKIKKHLNTEATNEKRPLSEKKESRRVSRHIFSQSKIEENDKIKSEKENNNKESINNDGIADNVEVKTEIDDMDDTYGNCNPDKIGKVTPANESNDQEDMIKSETKKMKRESIQTTTQERKHRCDICSKSYVHQKSLENHKFKEHSGEKVLESQDSKILIKDCRWCNKMFEGESLRKHSLQCEMKGTYKCYICDEVLQSKDALKLHLVIHRNDDDLTCKLCDKTFLNETIMQSHAKSHKLTKNKQCEKCGKGFYYQEYLLQHLERCTGEKSIECPDCSLKFKSPRALKIHSIIHDEARPYICHICGHTAKKGWYLSRHIRLHTGEKPYKCLTCGKVFGGYSGLARHKRSVHTKEKPYVCTFCGKEFICNGNLKTHLRQHTGETPYKCEYCGKGFKQKVLVRLHLKSHHQGQELGAKLA